MNYFKFQVPVSSLLQLIKYNNYKRVKFFIDLPSIARGFFNKEIIHVEINNYITTKKMPTIFIEEAKTFLNNLYNAFEFYSPKFVIFYDDGQCLQNTSIDVGYKADRISSIDLILDDNELQLFRQIKKYYYALFEQRFNINNISKVIYLKEYEADFVPYFYLRENIDNCSNKDCLNLILSADKDLLQCCQWPNVRQVTTNYSKKERKLIFYIFDDENALGYIYKNFKRGFLTSKYIPLLLALSGDESDRIKKVVPGIGPATAHDLIVKYKIPALLDEFTQLPSHLQPYIKGILKNYKLTSFEEQIKRLPFDVRSNLSNN